MGLFVLRTCMEIFGHEPHRLRCMISLDTYSWKLNLLSSENLDIVPFAWTIGKTPVFLTAGGTAYDGLSRIWSVRFGVRHQRRGNHLVDSKTHEYARISSYGNRQQWCYFYASYIFTLNSRVKYSYLAVSNKPLSGTMTVSKKTMDNSLNPAWRDSVVHIITTQSWDDTLLQDIADKTGPSRKIVLCVVRIECVCRTVALQEV